MLSAKQTFSSLTIKYIRKATDICNLTKRMAADIVMLSTLLLATVLCVLPYGLVVRIPGFHPGGPGSIPGVGTWFFSLMFFLKYYLWWFIKPLQVLYKALILMHTVNIDVTKLINVLRVGLATLPLSLYNKLSKLNWPFPSVCAQLTTTQLVFESWWENMYALFLFFSISKIEGFRLLKLSTW